MDQSFASSTFRSRYKYCKMLFEKQDQCIYQGWPNCDSRAVCGSSNLCTRLFELSKKLCIYFLFLLQSVEIV